MLQFDNFGAWITVKDGPTSTPMPEFSPTTDVNKKTVSCWIPSETGKSFAINFKGIQQTFHDYAGMVHVDGQTVGGRCGKRTAGVPTTLDTCVTSPISARPLLFSSLELTDDEDFMHSEVSEELGQITLKVYRVVLGGRKAQPDNRLRDLGQGKVHEKRKKAIAHAIKLGDEIVAAQSDVVEATYLEVLAVFIFRYRPLAVLQADGIAPLAREVSAPARDIIPSRKVSGEKRKAQAVSDEEGVELADEETKAEMKALQKRMEELKAKSGSSRKKVKTEPRPPVICKDIIDLT